MTESARMREPKEFNERHLEDVVEMTRAVGDRLRARILQVLREDSYSVSELCHLFDMPQPALSHHLKVLHLAGLVAKRREGNSIFYRRDVDPDDQLRQALFDSVDNTPIGAELSRNAAQIHDPAVIPPDALPRV